MQGASTYSFAFRVGMFSVHYSFTATYAVNGGSKKGADSEHRAHEELLDDVLKRHVHKPIPDPEHVMVDVPKKWNGWSRYRSYVAI